MRALIGSHGTIGQSILDHMSVDCVFNSDNIDSLPDHDIDQLIVAAPSGNRLYVNQNQQQDLASIHSIVTAIARAQPKHIVLVGSLDAVVMPHTVYGHNRLMLEQQLSTIAATTVLRMSTLIGSRIKKNMLYDIKHRKFIDHIDPDAVLQWCLLDDLPNLINTAIPGTTVNIVSEPIRNKDIVDRFCPDLEISKKHNSAFYNQGPYVYTCDQIFEAISKYLEL